MFSFHRVRDWGLLLACNLIWASQFVMVKIVQAQMGPVCATFFPITIAILLLIPIVCREGRTGNLHERMPRRDLLEFILLGVFGQVAAQLYVTWGVRLSTASNAALLMLALPITTAVMAYFLIGERSFYNVYSKKLLARYSPLQVLLYSYSWMWAVLTPLAIYLEPDGFRGLPHFSAPVWAGIALLALLQYFLSMVIFLNVLTGLDATQASLSNYLIPFFGVAIAAVVLHERLTAFIIAGGILVLASTLLVTVYEERQRSRVEALAAAQTGKQSIRGSR